MEFFTLLAVGLSKHAVSIHACSLFIALCLRLVVFIEISLYMHCLVAKSGQVEPAQQDWWHRPCINFQVSTHSIII